MPRPPVLVTAGEPFVLCVCFAKVPTPLPIAADLLLPGCRHFARRVAALGTAACFLLVGFSIKGTRRKAGGGQACAVSPSQASRVLPWPPTAAIIPHLPWLDGTRRLRPCARSANTALRVELAGGPHRD